MADMDITTKDTDTSTMDTVATDTKTTVMTVMATVDTMMDMDTTAATHTTTMDTIAMVMVDTATDMVTETTTTLGTFFLAYGTNLYDIPHNTNCMHTFQIWLQQPRIQPILTHGMYSPLDLEDI